MRLRTEIRARHEKVFLANAFWPAEKKNPGAIFPMLVILLFAFSCVSSPTKKDEEGLPPYESISYQVTVGNPQKALEEYEKAAAGGIQSDESKVLHARLLLIAGKTSEAKAGLKEILNSSPENVDALLTNAFISGIEGDKKEQRRILVKITEIDATSSPAFAFLGELFLEENNIKAAISYFGKALSSDPNNFVALQGYGNALMRNKEYDKAIESFDKAIAVDSKYIYCYMDRAKAKSLAGDKDAAIADLSEAIDLSQEEYYAFIDRGRLYLDKGKTEEAVSDFTAASRIDPEFFLAYVFLGGIYYDAKDYAKARLAYEKAAIAKPRYYFVYEPLGAIYYMEGNWLKAADAFAKAYKYTRDEHGYVLLAALSYKKAGKNKEALAYITSQMTSIPQDSWYFDVARFYYNPSNDVYAIRRADSERNPLQKKRILFYIAAQYVVSGKLRDTAISYLLDAENMERKDLVECTLSAWELEQITK